MRLGSLHIVAEETVTEELASAEAAEAVEAEASLEQPEAGQKEEAEKQKAETEGVEKADNKPPEAATDKFRNGNIVTGTVLNVNFQQAEIDLGDGEIGVLSGRHYAAGLQVDLTGELKAGDEVEAAVLIRADHNNRVVLSRTWARSQRAWKKIMEAKQNSTIIEAVIVEAVKGGYSVEIDDARGFLPSSLVVRSELAKVAGASAAEDEEHLGEAATGEAIEVETVADDSTGDAESGEKATDGEKAIDAEEATVAGETDGDEEAEMDQADGSTSEDEAARADELAEAGPTEADESAEADGSAREDEAARADELVEAESAEANESTREDEPAEADEFTGVDEPTEADESTRADELARADKPAEAEPSATKPDETQEQESQSSASVSRPRASDEFVGQIVKCKVIEAKPSSNRYVLSHKAAVRAEQRRQEKERVAALEKGTIVSGRVVALEDFGAFIDIGGARGLLHRTEMAWNHPNEPNEILKMGESVFCKIIKINKQKAQVGLSLCFGENPIGKVEVGQRLIGKVDRLAYAGAIVALEIPEEAAGGGSSDGDSASFASPKPQPMLHVAEGGSADGDSGDSEEEDGSESANGEVSESEKAAAGEADEPAETEGSNSASANGAISSQPSGASAAPSSPKCLLHGFVHVSEMSEYPIRRPQRVVLPGDEVAVKVIEVQRKQRRIGLSIIDAVVPDELDDDISDAAGGLEADARENSRISDEAEEVPEPKDTTDTEETGEESSEESSKAEPRDASEEADTENEDS